MGSDQFSELERIWALKESGVLTEEEFARLKAKALGSAPPSSGAKAPPESIPTTEPTSQAAASAEIESTTKSRSLKGWWTAIGLAFLGLVVLVFAVPPTEKNTADTRSENISTAAEETLSPEERQREEEKRRSEIAKLQQEVVAVPATDYDKNERIYARLAELEPSNREFTRKRYEYADKKRLAETYLTSPQKALQIVRHSWWKGGFGSIQLVSLTVKNDASFPIRDFRLKCVHQGPSGTDMDMNVRTVYERIPAHGSKSIPEVNMGFIHPQVATSRCEITDAVAD